jgi:hypothetical protein
MPKDDEIVKHTLRIWATNRGLAVDKQGGFKPPKLNENNNLGVLVESGNSGKFYQVPSLFAYYLYFTLDNSIYVTSGRNPRRVRSRVHRGPLIKVQMDDNGRIHIVHYEIVRGSEVAQIVDRIIFSGPVSELPDSLRIYESIYVSEMLKAQRHKSERTTKRKHKPATTQ